MRKHQIQDAAFEVATQVRAVEDSIDTTLVEMAELQARIMRVNAMAHTSYGTVHPALEKLAAAVSGSQFSSIGRTRRSTTARLTVAQDAAPTTKIRPARRNRTASRAIGLIQPKVNRTASRPPRRSRCRAGFRLSRPSCRGP